MLDDYIWQKDKIDYLIPTVIEPLLNVDRQLFQVLWLKAEVCKLLEEKRSALLRLVSLLNI